MAKNHSRDNQQPEQAGRCENEWIQDPDFAVSADVSAESVTAYKTEENQPDSVQDAEQSPAGDTKTAEETVTDSSASAPEQTETAFRAETSAAQPAKKQIPPSKGKHGRPLKTDPYGNPIKKKKKDKPLRSQEPVKTVTPADIHKPQVSFMNSIATLEPASRARWTGSTTSQAYDHAVIRSGGDSGEQYEPKIRKMSESTRAKQLRKRKAPDGPLPYQKDSPVEKVPALPSRKKKRKKQEQEAEELSRIPERLTEVGSELTVTQKLSIADAAQIDFSVGQPPAERVQEYRVREREEKKARAEARRERTFSRPEDRDSVRNDLMELKTSLSIRAVLIGIIFFFSALITILDWIPRLTLPSFLSSTESPVSYLTIQILLGLLCLPLSGDMLKTGYMKLLQLRADSDSLAAMSLMSAELSAILLLPSPDMLRQGICSSYISVGLLSVFVNTLSKKMTVQRAIRNFEVLSDGSQKYGIRYVENEKRAENLTRGTTGDFPILATMQPVDNPKDFLKYTFSSDLGDKFCRTAVPIMFILSAAFAITMSVLRQEEVESAICYGNSIFALCFSAFACTAITLISSMPMESGTKTYVRNSGILLGYQSVDDFYDINTVMVDARTLFPRDSAKLESIELFTDFGWEKVLTFAAAITKRAGSILRSMFASALDSDERSIPSVEDYAYDEGRGISGWIRNQRVLLGTREMMIAHNIEGLPPVQREDDAAVMGNRVLYLSVSGTVLAMFVIRLEASKTIKHWLRALDREQIFLMVRSNDALLSQRGIAKLFAFPEDLLKVIPARLESEYAAETEPVRSARPSMLCAGRLPGFIQTIVGAKRIRSAAALGLLLQIVTACLGFIYVLVFILLSAYEDISGGLLLTYHLICTIVTIASVRLKDT